LHTQDAVGQILVQFYNCTIHIVQSIILLYTRKKIVYL